MYSINHEGNKVMSKMLWREVMQIQHINCVKESTFFCN